jgi:hypothetical protein
MSTPARCLHDKDGGDPGMIVIHSRTQNGGVRLVHGVAIVGVVMAGDLEIRFLLFTPTPPTSSDMIAA